MTVDLLRRTLIWDAPAGILLPPRNDLSVLDEWRMRHADYLGIIVGFDVLPRHETLAVLTAYRRCILASPERFRLVFGF
ncbi:hypothetical protein GS636_20730 [Ruegeria sp. HKCCD4884]|uniref:hypothetical protein n=1 Tax=Ruegeria sp. HKCCD4884 TaxID=2683022 RepID=UPI001491F9A7|nr:hypothetical protein [Ruegeria sp. HKCCD4884]NOD95230.1 hypothetical protein [Ruegeria sp. HKCCD4884]